MTEEEAQLIARVDAKVDRIIEIVQAQNAVLAEHSKRLETLGKDLTLLNEVQRTHGTTAEHLVREVRALQFGNHYSDPPNKTPIPTLAPDLIGAEGD